MMPLRRSTFRNRALCEFVELRSFTVHSLNIHVVLFVTGTDLDNAPLDQEGSDGDDDVISRYADTTNSSAIKPIVHPKQEPVVSGLQASFVWNARPKEHHGDIIDICSDSEEHLENVESIRYQSNVRKNEELERKLNALKLKPKDPSKPPPPKRQRKD